MENIATITVLTLSSVLAFLCGWMLCAVRQRDVARSEQQEYARLISVEALARQRELQLTETSLELKDTAAALQVADNEVARLQTAIEVAHTTLRQQQAFAAERMEILERQNSEFTKKLDAISAKYFVENNSRLTNMAETQLNGLLVPLREQLGEFRKRVEDTYDRDSQDRHMLKAEISQLKSLNERISKDAINLTNALRGDNKTLGNWGELVLERVLESAGLEKGREFDREVTFTDASGKRLRPDVLLHLPGGKNIIVDSKVSVKDFEKSLAQHNESERQKSVHLHVKALRRHVESLSSKQYELIDGANSLDFVIMFVPVEAAFQLALEHDRSLYQDAYEKDVLIVGPSSLMVTCRTIQNVWRAELQNKNSKQIARKAGELIDKFTAFTAELDKVGNALATASDSYELARRRLGSGRGNLISRARAIQQLGACGKAS